MNKLFMFIVLIEYYTIIYYEILNHKTILIISHLCIVIVHCVVKLYIQILKFVQLILKQKTVNYNKLFPTVNKNLLLLFNLYN